MDFAEFDVRAKFGGDVISALTAEIGMGQQAKGSRPFFIWYYPPFRPVGATGPDMAA